MYFLVKSLDNVEWLKRDKVICSVPHAPSTEDQDGVGCDHDHGQHTPGHINRHVTGAVVPQNVRRNAVVGVEGEVAKSTSEGVD